MCVTKELYNQGTYNWKICEKVVQPLAHGQKELCYVLLVEEDWWVNTPPEIPREGLEWMGADASWHGFKIYCIL